QTVRKSYNEITKNILTDTVQGFRRNYNYSLNTGLSTKIYGLKNFRKGNLLAIRHVLTPTFGLSYTPDFSSNGFGFYKDIAGLPANSTIRSRYSIFESSPGGGPGLGKSASLNFGFDNTVEAKVKSKSDTTVENRIVPIIQGLSFSGTYDFNKTEFDKLSTIGFSGRTSFFKQKLGISFNGSLDPYKLDANSQRIGYLYRDGKIARLSSFSFSTGFSLNPSSFIKRQEELNKQQNNPNTSAQQKQNISEILRNPNGFVDFSIPWNLSASYSFFYSNTGNFKSVTNNLNFNGDFSVTPKWKVTYTSGWDFKENDFTTTSFSINRDLHCWDLAMSWVPFGQFKSYSVDLRVRASILQDLKLSRRSPYGGYR
ncbi:MAG: LPS-assembly protein LptD, partial [Pyrinomonadaceae bacterium]|nr:LPS-assembly protein LptD [Sphingobacteriaceae bacterium]